MHVLLFDGHARVVWHTADVFWDEALAGADDATPWNWCDNPEETLGALLTALVGGPDGNEPAETTVEVSGRRYRAVFHPVDAPPVCAVAFLHPLSAQVEGLSQRELDVLVHLANGLSIPDLAQKLSASKSTISGYRKRVYKKLGCHGLAELTRFAVCAGLVPVEWPTDPAHSGGHAEHNGHAIPIGPPGDEGDIEPAA